MHKIEIRRSDKVVLIDDFPVGTVAHDPAKKRYCFTAYPRARLPPKYNWVRDFQAPQEWHIRANLADCAWNFMSEEPPPWLVPEHRAGLRKIRRDRLRAAAKQNSPKRISRK